MAKAHKKIEQYVKDDSMSQTQRAAHFLDWAAKNMPGEYQAYNVILKAVLGQKMLPRQDGDQVKLFKASIPNGVKRALLDKYDREIVTLPGIGVRATVDDADRLTNVAPIRARRLNASRRAFLVTATGIDLAKVPDTPELAGLKAWMGTEVRTVLKTLGSPEFERKLLPPGIEQK